MPWIKPFTSYFPNYTVNLLPEGRTQSVKSGYLWYCGSFIFEIHMYLLNFLKIIKLYNNTIHLNKLLYAKQILLTSKNMYRISMNKSGKKITITPQKPTTFW